MTRLFVTSSGTEIGKTFVTAVLLHALSKRGRRVGALKPVVSGMDEMPLAESDPGILLRAQARAPTEEAIAEIAPWRFGAPLSPDMAAAREGRDIPYDEVSAFCRTGIDGPYDDLFVEGAGGVMVPLGPGRLLVDLMVDLGLPALLVVGGYLGTISHTLTAAKTLESFGVPLRAVVVNESGGPLPVPLAETAEAIARYLPGTPVVPLPRADGEDPWTRLPGSAVEPLLAAIAPTGS